MDICRRDFTDFFKVDFKYINKIYSIDELYIKPFDFKFLLCRRPQQKIDMQFFATDKLWIPENIMDLDWEEFENLVKPQINAFKKVMPNVGADLTHEFNLLCEYIEEHEFDTEYTESTVIHSYIFEEQAIALKDFISKALSEPLFEKNSFLNLPTYKMLIMPIQ